MVEEGGQRRRVRNVKNLEYTETESRTYGRGFATMFPDVLVELANDLSPTAFRILIVLVREMNQRNELRISRKRLSELTGKESNHLSTYMRELHEKGAIQILEKNPYRISISEQFFWKNSVDAYWRHRHEQNNATDTGDE